MLHMQCDINESGVMAPQHIWRNGSPNYLFGVMAPKLIWRNGSRLYSYNTHAVYHVQNWRKGSPKWRNGSPAYLA